MHAMLSSKVSTLAPSPIQLMAARTREAREAGRDVVDLTLGEPDFATPEHICEAARRAIADGLTKYTPISGLARLREAVARKFRDENGIECTAAETLVGCGGKQVIYQAFVATIDPGDEVLIPAPYWSSYADIVTLCGGIVKPLPTTPESGYALQPQTLAAGISARTKWLVLNAPSNPSGTAYTAAQLEAFAEVLRRSGNPRLLILADDIYEHIVFDGLRFASFAAVAPDLRHRTLTVNGVSKAYAMTGWRVGYGCGPKPLIDAMANVQMQVNSHTASISQAAAIAALEAAGRAGAPARHLRAAPRQPTEPPGRHRGPAHPASAGRVLSVPGRAGLHRPTHARRVRHRRRPGARRLSAGQRRRGGPGFGFRHAGLPAPVVRDIGGAARAGGNATCRRAAQARRLIWGEGDVEYRHRLLMLL